MLETVFFVFFNLATISTRVKRSENEVEGTAGVRKKKTLSPPSSSFRGHLPCVIFFFKHNMRFTALWALQHLSVTAVLLFCSTWRFTAKQSQAKQNKTKQTWCYDATETTQHNTLDFSSPDTESSSLSRYQGASHTISGKIINAFLFQIRRSAFPNPASDMFSLIPNPLFSPGVDPMTIVSTAWVPPLISAAVNKHLSVMPKGWN